MEINGHEYAMTAERVNIGTPRKPAYMPAGTAVRLFRNGTMGPVATMRTSSGGYFERHDSPARLRVFSDVLASLRPVNPDSTNDCIAIIASECMHMFSLSEHPAGIVAGCIARRIRWLGESGSDTSAALREHCTRLAAAQDAGNLPDERAIIIDIIMGGV